MRQSNVVAATVLAAAIATAATVSAQTRPEAQAKPATPHLAPGLSTKPYSSLFDQQRLEASAALRSKMQSMRSNFMRPNSARRFICGIIVLPADSSIDPKFEAAPADKTTRFSLRVLAPGQCH